MKINVEDIFKFHKIRMACHIKSVNYFASLFGYCFPDHDADKNDEQIRIWHAYITYNKYHPELKLLDEYFTLCNDAQQMHYKHASHHVQYYSDVSKIPDIRIYEMVSDWASADFELHNVLKVAETQPLEKWFADNMSHLSWSEHQIELIKKSLKTIKEKSDKNKIMNIWQDLIKCI